MLPHKSDTSNIDNFQNSDTLFARTKMSLLLGKLSLLLEREGFHEKNKLFSLNIGQKRTHFLLFLKNHVMQDLI